MLHSVTANPFFAKGIFAFDTLLFGSFFKSEEKYVERDRNPQWGTYIHEGRFLFICTSVFTRYYSLDINIKYIKNWEMPWENL